MRWYLSRVTDQFDRRAAARVLTQIVPAVRTPRRLGHFRRVDAMQSHLDARIGANQRACVAVVAVIDGARLRMGAGKYEQCQGDDEQAGEVWQVCQFPKRRISGIRIVAGFGLVG